MTENILYPKGCNNKEHKVETGHIDGYYYEIWTMILHPTAYIKVPEKSVLRMVGEVDVGILNELGVHGGITYINGDFIGWDYGHAGDYLNSSNIKDSMVQGYKWTLEEIREEIKIAVKKFPKIETEVLVNRY